MPTIAKPIKTTKPRPTAAERKAAEVGARAEREARDLAAWAEFEKNRPTVWMGLWAKALRLQLLVQNEESFREAQSWWFDDFMVSAASQAFSVAETGSSRHLTQDKLHPADVERIGAGLARGLELFTNHQAELECQRQIEIERQRRREVALDKLDDEDRKALGLR